MFVFLFCMFFFLFCIFFVFILFRVFFLLLYIAVIAIFVQIYRPLQPGVNPIAVNKYLIASLHCFKHEMIKINTLAELLKFYTFI